LRNGPDIFRRIEQRMLTNPKFRIPEIVLGILLAVALFSLGVVWSFVRHPQDYIAVNRGDETIPKKETSNTPGDRIFGWQAIDAFTGLLFLATVGLGIVTVWGIRNQSRETKIIQRAYLAVEPDGVRPLRSNIGHISGYVKIVNKGHLPARDARSWIGFKYAKGEDCDDFPLKEPEKGIVIGPGVEASQGTWDSIDTAEIIKLAAKEKDGLFFYVWGIIYYHDGFVEGRHIRFCHRYRWQSFIDGGGSTGLSANAVDARYHTHGNTTDEDSSQ
jgi:hypothetical protein